MLEVFEGNLGDPSTLANQVRKLRMRFRLKRIVLVGDRGMITQARIDADLEPAGFELDHRAARPDHPGPGGRGRPPAALAVRRARHGGDRLGRLSRRASHRLSQPRTGGRARAQARRTHRCDREGAGQDPRGDRAKAQSAPRQGQDRPQGRRGDRPSPHGQAFRTRHHRYELRLVAQGRRRRRRSRARRHLW